MFMEAEVPAGGPADASSVPVPAPTAAPTPEPAGPQIGASDAKGWTVFMEKQPIPAPGQEAPAAAADELAATLEHQAQPPAEALATGNLATAQLPAQPPAEAAPAPGAAPAHQAPAPTHQPAPVVQAPHLPAPQPPTGLAPQGGSKTGVYAAVAVVGVIILIAILKLAGVF